MEKLLTVEELSESLGVSKHTLYGWVSKRRLPYLKINNKIVRFRKSDIDAWIQNKLQPAKEKLTSAKHTKIKPITSGDKIFQEVLENVL